MFEPSNRGQVKEVAGLLCTVCSVYCMYNRVQIPGFSSQFGFVQTYYAISRAVGILYLF